MKDKTLAAILAFFFGSLGIHQFYLGNTTKGIFYLIFCWTGIPLLISIIDFFMLLFTSQTQFDEDYNKGSKRDSFEEKVHELNYLRSKKNLTTEEKARLYDLEN